MIRIIAIVLMSSLISCGGDSITKANDITQVVDAHFEYKDIKHEYTGIRKGGLGDGRLTYRFTGKIKNNSGINIRQANFWIRVFQGERRLSMAYGDITIEQFVNDTTREFESTAYPESHDFDKITITYDPD